MYEHKGEKLLPFPRFVGRVGLSVGIAMSIVAVGLLIGTLGYHFLAGLGWLDAELNAAMILTGMGPVDPLRSTGAKVFASAYAIFSGVVFITAIGLFLSPIFHRIIHKFHLGAADDGEKGAAAAPKAGAAKAKP